MLVVTRRVDQIITIGEHITVMVVGIFGDQIRLGIEAPKEMAILRHDAIVKKEKDEP